MTNDLQIVQLTKAKLREALAENLYWKGGLAPMPKSKAEWLLKNDRIEENDYCGVLAFEDEKMIAFIYMFPDYLRISETAYEKVYWELIWWVDKAFKNTVLGTYVYNESVNLAEKKIIIKSFAEHMNEFYNKQPFDEISSRLRHTLFFSIDKDAVLSKFSFLKSFKIVIDQSGKFADRIIRAVNTKKYKKRTKSLSYESLITLDNQTWEFIEPLCKNDLIFKTKDYVDWQLDESQHTVSNKKEPLSYKALVPGISPNIRLKKIKVLKDNKLIGFIAYIVNFNEFNVKYFLSKNVENYNSCVDALIEHFIEEKTNYLYTDDTKLSNTINERYKVIYTYKILKKALIHKEIKADLKGLNLYERDGHFY